MGGLTEMRKSTGKRLRFEILKRDGFRCRYCGRTAIATPLHVDHVIAVANGGTNDHENLASSCADCNGGKSSIPLDDSKLANDRTAGALRDHAEQVLAVLDAAKELEASRTQVVEWLADQYAVRVQRQIPTEMVRILRGAIDRNSMEDILYAFDAVAVSISRGTRMDAGDETKYFCGCLRRIRGEA